MATAEKKIQCLRCKKMKLESEFSDKKIMCRTCTNESHSANSSSKSGGWLDSILDALTDW